MIHSQNLIKLKIPAYTDDMAPSSSMCIFYLPEYFPSGNLLEKRIKLMDCCWEGFAQNKYFPFTESEIDTAGYSKFLTLAHQVG